MINKTTLEEKQIGIYIATLLLSVVAGLSWNNGKILEHAIEPVIGILLYSMFCQVPFLELRQAFKNKSFFKALLFGNFVFIPILVALLIFLFPTYSRTTIGVLLVLLTPCIDYVIVFTHLGKGDAQAVLASTPLLFLSQVLLLPLFLALFPGKEITAIIAIAPFLKAFLFLVVLPFLLALATRILSTSGKTGEKIMAFSGWLPVPLMALTFFVVITSQIGTLRNNPQPIITVLPIYITFALLAPFAGRIAGKMFKVDYSAARALSFSTSTRNSLVVLPLALSLPAPHHHLVAVVIVTQTIVEIGFALLYIKIIPLLIRPPGNHKA